VSCASGRSLVFIAVGLSVSFAAGAGGVSPTALTAFRPGEVKVGGEVGRRLEVTAEKMVHHTDVEKTFVRHFRTRRDKPEEPGGFAGYGMFLDALVKAAAHGIGGQETIAFKEKLLKELPSLVAADGSFSMYKNEVGYWDSHEVSYLIQAVARDYQWFGTASSLELAKRLADSFIVRKATVTIGTEMAFVLMAEVTGDDKYRRYLENTCRIADDIRSYHRFSKHLGVKHVYTWLARAHGQVCACGLCANGETDRFLAAADEAIARAHGPYLSVSGSITGSPGWGELWDATQTGLGSWGETCASAYLMRLSAGLLELRGDAAYGDLFERVMYNAFFSAQSPDGLKYRYWTPFNETPPWFDRDTYCCPNNYKREVFEIPDAVFFRAADGLAVNLFTPAVLSSDGIRAKMETDYPAEGRVSLDVTLPRGHRHLWLRIPAWCGEMRVDGRNVDVGTSGWCDVTGDFSVGRRLAIEMEIPVRTIAGERAQEGRVAFMRGPCVYSLDFAANGLTKRGHAYGYDLDLSKSVSWKDGAIEATLQTEGPAPRPKTVRLTRYCEPGRSRTYFDTLAPVEAEADELKSATNRTSAVELSLDAPKQNLLPGKLIASIDCTAEPPPGRYVEYGKVVVTNGPAGRYRETAPTALSRFGYRLDIPHPGRPHLYVVHYPDDRTRCMLFSDGSSYDLSVGVFTGSATVKAHGRGYSGLAQPLSNRMLEQRNIFWPRTKESSIVFSNTTDGQPTAAASVDVYELDDVPPLEIASAAYPRRSFGTSYEDPCSHGSDFGAVRYEEWLDRAVTMMKHTGQNILVYPILWYHGPLYPSKVDRPNYFDCFMPSPVDRKMYVRWTDDPGDWPEMLMDRFDREGLDFVAQACYIRLGSLMKQMNSDTNAVAKGADTVNVVWKDGYVQPGTGDWTYAYDVHDFNAFAEASANGTNNWSLVPLASGEKTGRAVTRQGPIFDPAHPAVRAAVLRSVREIAERYGKHRSFRGLNLFSYGSSFFHWRNLDCGFGDAAIARFERETGEKVPTAEGVARFMARGRFLLSHDRRKRWADWRCSVITELLSAMRDELRRVRPDLELSVGFSHRVDRDHMGLDLAALRAAGVLIRSNQYNNDPCVRPFDGETLKSTMSYNVYNNWIERWGKRHWWKPCAPGEPEKGPLGQILGRPAQGMCREGCEYDKDGFWWPDSQIRIAPAFSGGIHYLRPLASAVAETDPLVLTSGGLTFDRAHADLMRPFARNFRVLPRVKFQTLGKTDTSVATVRSVVTEGARWVYLVNREFYGCRVRLNLPGDTQAVDFDADGQIIALKKGDWTIDLGPYELRTFALPTNVEVGYFGEDVPDSAVHSLRTRAAAVGKRLADTKEPKVREALQTLSEAVKSANWPLVRGVLESAEIVKAQK